MPLTDADLVALKLSVMEAARIATLLVGALRRGIPGEPRIAGGTAVLALLFAAARVHRLRGGSRDTLVHVAGTFFDLAADQDEVRALSPRGGH